MMRLGQAIRTVRTLLLTLLVATASVLMPMVWFADCWH